jgi:uncharacterized protein (DUF1501 family)
MVGGVTCAGWGLDVARYGWDATLAYADHLLTPQQFATRHGNRFTFIHGIDTSTNNHDGGQRVMGSGRLTTGYPSLGTLIAAARAPELPMAYLSAGGFDATEGQVPLTRVQNADALARVARPLEISAGEANTELFHTQETMDRIARVQRERLQAQLDHQRLPSIRSSLEALRDARAATRVLDRLVLPATQIELGLDGLGDLQGFMRDADVALAAFKSGLTACASVVLSGFDTHGDHDDNQSRQILKLLGGLDYALAQADSQGLGANLYIVVSSDFGRGPQYNGDNDGAGKDHWPVTSMLAMGPGIAGGRVVGATDENQLARTLDPKSLAPTEGGMKLKPEHVHIALRKIAGIEDDELTKKYPLPGDSLPVFG